MSALATEYKLETHMTWSFSATVSFSSGREIKPPRGRTIRRELAKAQVRLNADVGPKSSQPTTGAPPGGGGLSLGGLLPSSIKEGDWAAMGSVPQPKLGKSTSHYLGKIQSFLADPLVCELRPVVLPLTALCVSVVRWCSSHGRR